MTRARSLAAAVAVLALCVGVGLSQAGGAPSDPDALWKVVHDLCVPGQERHGNPAPCRLVELRDGEERGYALLKDLVGASEFLLIPTARITGIESPTLLAPDAPNYFAEAWRVRRYLDRALGKVMRRDEISLAVNSMSGRSQNQLHIHIDCVREDVLTALGQYQDAIGDRWSPLDAPLAGHQYMAVRVDGEDLDQANPFTLLADGVPGAREDMGHHTLVVIGATFAGGRPGFIILDDHVNPDVGDRASGEELQDHGCAVAK
jgi:CDP-diacylglycerol pyrophosphatase